MNANEIINNEEIMAEVAETAVNAIDGTLMKDIGKFGAGMGAGVAAYLGIKWAVAKIKEKKAKKAAEAEETMNVNMEDIVDYEND